MDTGFLASQLVPYLVEKNKKIVLGKQRRKRECKRRERKEARETEQERRGREGERRERKRETREQVAKLPQVDQ